MQDLSLHILDVAENSLRAGATRVEIRIAEDVAGDLLRLEISDNGQGMEPELCQRVISPFVTSREDRRVGLGLALLAQASREAGGECHVESQPGKGTRVTATFRHSHIDRKPLGDLGETFVALAATNPQVDFLLEIQGGGETRRLDTRDLRSNQGKARPPVASPQR
jgi:hypothetical protein